MNTTEKNQRRVLQKLLKLASGTDFGRQHGFGEISSPEQYAKAVAIQTYEDVAPWVVRMKNGEADVLWPGTVNRFAISAGTTGTPKEMPLPKQRETTDRRFMRKVVLNYFLKRPNIFSLLGTQLSLTGNVEPSDEYPGVTFGEVSGFLGLMAPWYLARLQVIHPKTMAALPFSKKMDLALRESVDRDVRVISALPSVTLRFLQNMLERTGKTSIAEVWPNLRIFVSGGEPLGSFRTHIEKLCEGLEIDFIENYGASEGYFAFNTDPERTDMQLVTDNDVYYEWIPNPPADRAKLLEATPIPTWQVEAGVPCAMIVTTSSGIWRYALNDVIEFTETGSKPRIRVRGRISDIMAKYGEDIEAAHILQVLDHVTKALGAEYSSYTAGSILNDESRYPTHAFFIEWVKKPDDMHDFAVRFDGYMQKINRSFQIRREGDSIAFPRFFDLTKDVIEAWQKQFFNVRAQTKLPRIIHDQEKVEDLMARCGRNKST